MAIIKRLDFRVKNAGLRMVCARCGLRAFVLRASCVPEVAQKRGVEEAKTENHEGGAAGCGDPPRVRAWWFQSRERGPGR